MNDVTPSGAENENRAQPLHFRPEEPAAVTAVPRSGRPLPHDPAEALDTARTRDRLDWEARCESLQARINRAYALELQGKDALQFAWLVMRLCLVVLLGSCVIFWTGFVALYLTYTALFVLGLSIVVAVVGGSLEHVAQLWQGGLLRQGKKNHLDVYDPSLRPAR